MLRKKPNYFTSWDDVPIVMDVATAARILAVPYECLRMKVQRGELPASKVGTLWRITKTSLMKYVGEEESRSMAV